MDSDLHGLVDGLIEPDRRGEALRRLTTSPADRARVEAWQNQNDLLRSAFGGIAREALPPMLDLRVRPKLLCLPPGETAAAPAEVAEEAKTVAAHRWVATLFLTLALAGAGFGGWRYFTSMSDLPGVVEAAPVDAVLATRAEDALTRTGPVPAANPQLAKALPASRIPDLDAAGFSFVGAETEGHAPASIAFRYQNDYGERLVICVGALGATATSGASSADKGGTAPTALGDSYTWHQGDHAYAIAGNLRAARLRALAISLFSAGA